MDKARLERLNDEIQRKEEMLQEAKMEKERAVVELGREKDCNRVILKSYDIFRSLIIFFYFEQFFWEKYLIFCTSIKKIFFNIFKIMLVVYP